MALERLVEGLGFEWRSERAVESLLRGAQELADAPEVDAALAELEAAARGRRARVERRLSGMASRPLLAGVPEVVDRLEEALEKALGLVRAAADRYAALAELARQLRDPETAFACELNRIGAEEAAGLLDVLLASEVERRIRMGGPRPAVEPAPS